MNKIIFSFITTALAGFSTLLGVIPCFFNKKYKDNIVAFTLSFSSGVMLSISICSLIPEAVELLKDRFLLFPLFLISFIFVVVGVIISFFTSNSVDLIIPNNKLYKLGIISIIVLVLHNIPEGITTFISTTSNTTLGIKLAIAIALHNIPEGISIAIPIYFSTNSFKKAFLYTFIAGFSELLGAFIAYLFIAKYVTDFLLAVILLITAGIMIHISVYELLPVSLQYKKKKATTLAFVIGFLILILCGVFLK